MARTTTKRVQVVFAPSCSSLYSSPTRSHPGSSSSSARTTRLSRRSTMESFWTQTIRLRARTDLPSPPLSGCQTRWTRRAGAIRRSVSSSFTASIGVTRKVCQSFASCALANARITTLQWPRVKRPPSMASSRLKSVRLMWLLMRCTLSSVWMSLSRSLATTIRSQRRI